MNKKEADYIDLCEDVRKCKICQDIKFTPHIEKSNCFIQDKKPNDEVYVNRWNLLQNSLEAESWLLVKTMALVKIIVL